MAPRGPALAPRPLVVSRGVKLRVTVVVSGSGTRPTSPCFESPATTLSMSNRFAKGRVLVVIRSGMPLECLYVMLS